MAGRKIGVIAGTPVDAAMGVEVLKGRGYEAIPYPAAASAREQTEFQLVPMDERVAKVRALMQKTLADGRQGVLVYCNSLSANLDFPALARELNVPVVTPLDAYREYARDYRVLGVAAANNQALAGIERAIMGGNPECDVYGICFLPAVTAIEAGVPPAEIVRRFGLNIVLDWFAHIKAEALILGCTHFPYLAAELSKRAKLPLLDPADRMCELLEARIQ
ncbi:MAG: aspartate/glutamate racemase family protein [Deltaproteobacteria bacterium]|jgi:glutamate racemase|nr:aspartate/glutamate racemase family protein [Deltaproteobacteria bacterium]